MKVEVTDLHVNSIERTLRYDPYNLSTQYGSGSFLDMLTAEQKIKEGVEAPGYVRVEAAFPYGSQQILRAEAVDDLGRRQSIRVEYAPSSTPEDPIVMIYGTSYYGEYRNVRRLRDIDLTNASYTELYALLAHEKALEMERAGGPLEESVPYTSDVTLDKLVAELPAGDFMESRNFLDEYAKANQLVKVSVQVPITPDETITMEHRVDTSVEDAAAAAEFERLMRVVDNFIEAIQEDAEARKEKAEKEKIQQLAEKEREEEKQALERIDHEKLLEELVYTGDLML